MKTVEETLPDELNDVLNSREFNDDYGIGGIIIESVSLKDQRVVLIFSIRFEEDNSKQLWQLRADQVCEERVMNEWTCTMNIYRQHPQLLAYNDTHTELYFKGTTTRSTALFIDIFKSLREEFTSLSDISNYIISPEEIDKLTSQGYGIFARGPKTILKIYAACIGRYGLKPIFLEGNEYPSVTKPLKLLRMGSSYVIAESFVFKRMVRR